MAAIIGESLLYEVSRVIRGEYHLSYYQYKALESFIEAITLHNRIVLFAGEEDDSEYLKSFDWLINVIHEKTNCSIDIVSSERRNEYITTETMYCFEQICREIYQHSLGITSNDLFSKQKKDRTSEDMSERIEKIFARYYPNFDCTKFGEGIYETLQKNANSSELLYFFRAHLFQSIAEIQNLTPIFENQRLIAAIAHSRCRKNNKIGTLPYTIYRMANNLFVKAYSALPNSKINNPRNSILIQAMIEKASGRSDILDSVFHLRTELEDFRNSYDTADKALYDSDKSLYERAEIQRSLEESIKEIWVPVINSLGHDYTPSKIIKIAKGIFGKYGIGDVKLEHIEKKDTPENKATYSTPSLIGIGTAIAQTVSEAYKDSKLIKPNKPLLDIILRVSKLTDVRQNLALLLPVRGFEYRVFKLIDTLLVEDLEVSQ